VGNANSIGLRADRAILFPGNGAFNASLEAPQGTINLNTGAVVLQAASLEADIGNAVSLNAVNVALNFDPAQTNPTAPVITILSATLTVGSLRDGNNQALTVQIGNPDAGQPALVVRRNGFTLGNPTVRSPAFVIDGALAVTNLDVAINNVSYAVGGALAGSIAFSAGSLALFPGNSVLTSGAASLTGSITLGQANASLSLAPPMCFWPSARPCASRRRTSVSSPEHGFGNGGSMTVRLPTLRICPPVR